MSLIVTSFVSAFLLPPLNVLVLLVIGILQLKQRPALAKTLLLMATGLLWFCATPYCVNIMLNKVESSTVALLKPLPSAQAIVILGSGTYYHAPDYDGMDTVNEDELARLRYGARLQRQTQLPILLSGGKPLGSEVSEAEQMRQVLDQEFNIPVRWLEADSNTTFENARNSRKILQAAGINRVFLVTHAVDMHRAAMIFRQFGVEVIEAPTLFTTKFKTTVLSFVPNAQALAKCARLGHELIGILWYRIKITINI